MGVRVKRLYGSACLLALSKTRLPRADDRLRSVRQRALPFAEWQSMLPTTRALQPVLQPG